jgi:hypothetical protein
VIAVQWLALAVLSSNCGAAPAGFSFKWYAARKLLLQLAVVCRVVTTPHRIKLKGESMRKTKAAGNPES